MRQTKVIDRFFREGIERAAGTEDLITIGMRGDGDAPMGGEEGNDHNYVSRDEYNMNLLRKIFKNQRQIIKDVTAVSPRSVSRYGPYIKRCRLIMTSACVCPTM